MPFMQLLDAFLIHSKPKASYAVYRRMQVQYFSKWARRWPTANEIEDWHEALKATPHQANKGLSFLKAMFNWGIKRGHCLGPNPAQRIKRHTVTSRERVMSESEVRILLASLGRMPPKFSALLLVLLTTGCRLTEARTMQKQFVSMTTGQWYQPTTKNGHPHTTYLPIQTRAALAQLSTSTDYFFAGAYEHCWSRAGIEKVWGEWRRKLGLFDVRLHDFRRTFATMLYRETKDDYLVKKCINHVKKDVTGIYVRITYDEQAQAMQAQADRLWRWREEPHDERHNGSGLDGCHVALVSSASAAHGTP